LVPALQDKGHRVHAVRRLDGDVAEPATWQGYPDADVVVHLAANNFVPASWQAPWAVLRENVLGAVAALDYCRERGSRLILPSSYMYGNPDRLPVTEDAPVRVNNPYALSKSLAEQVCQFYSMSFGVGTIIMRLFNVYGPGQGDDFLIPTIIRQLHAGDEIRLQDLTPRRDFVYVLDVVDAISRAIAAGGSFVTINIGSGESHSVRDLVETIQRVWGTALPLRSDEAARPAEIMDTVADISRAAEQLGWKPRYDLLHGVEDMHAHDKRAEGFACR
jgi:nucleoside-diphosphate-sugar epimerase